VVEAPSESSLEPGYPGVVLFVIVHSLPVSVARWRRRRIAENARSAVRREEDPCLSVNRGV
jgi:hypothetical protein